MAEINFTPKKYLDSIFSFESGVQSGESPLLLPKNQIGIGVNCSLREGFVHPRPPMQIKTLNFNGNTALQTLVLTGLFQGAGYYRPDFGTESLLASISGHLIMFQESGLGGPWNVTDVSVPNDFNSSTNPQCWMWQSEKWMIVNDGTGKLPIFFDGTTSRRSFGPTVVLGTVSGTPTPGTPPPIYVPIPIPPINGTTTGTTNSQSAASILVTLTAPYTGPYNVPVIFNGEFYQASAVNFSGPSTNNIQLTNLTDTPGNTIGMGAAIQVQSNLLALIATGGTASQPIAGNQWDAQLNLRLTNTNNLSINQNIRLFFTANLSGGGSTPTSSQFQIIAINAPLSTVTVNSVALASNITSITVNAGSEMTTGSTTFVTLGTAVNAFVVPNVNGTVNATMSQPFTGAAGQLVVIGSAVYEIQAIGAPIAANQLTLINLTDTSTNSYASGLVINSVPELPAGRMGAYGNGRNWFSLTNGTNYEAGDIVGGGSGTPAYNYRDSVLKTTENDFLVNGGTFSLPNTGEIITAMNFPPTLDSSLGVGSLQIFTPFTVFANNAPADRTTWANLAWPIQSLTLKDQGAMAQDSAVLVNSDVLFRSDFNLCSLVLARRDFGASEWGNKPIGNEMQRILQLDNPALLGYGSGVSFDNRLLMSCSPVQSGNGVYHSGIISLNYDLISSLRTKLPAAWEGAWTGLNLLKILTGRVNGMRRCFGFGFNLNTVQLELYELYSEAYAQQNQIFQDNVSVPIVWMFETSVMFNKDIHDIKELIQLRDGELQVSNITSSAKIQVYYRPDFYPCWTLWREIDVCTDTSAPNSNSTGHTRLGLGEPSSTVPGVNRPMRIGRFFQFRFVVTGYCNINAFHASAVTTAEPVFSPVNPQSNKCTAINCTTVPDLSLYSLEGASSTVIPPVFNFFNQQVVFVVACTNQTLNYTGVLPPWITLDQVNNQLIAAAGTFGGIDQASANVAAQNALNAFADAELVAGSLACASCTFNNQLIGHTYGIQGYTDGMIKPPSTPGCSGSPVWNGIFAFYQTVIFGFSNCWSAIEAGAGGICISSYATGGLNTVVGFKSCSNNVITWEISIPSIAIWQKIGGLDPTGVYTYLSGTSPQPNLTIVQLT